MARQAPGTGGAPAPDTSTGPPAATPTTTALSAQPKCRSGSPLANVYHSYRLQVRNACMTVTGTVAYVSSESDGDVHVDLALPASESGLLDQANFTYQDGQLVTEIVPADRPGCTPGQPPRPSYGTYDYGICTGADIATPPVGAEVSVTGPYVLDSDHGWMEIHPVWSVTVLAGPASSSGPPISTPATGPPGPPTCSVTASYSSTYQDYDVYVHSNQPDRTVTVTASGGAVGTWTTSSDGYADVYLHVTGSGSGQRIVAAVGAASCTAVLP